MRIALDAMGSDRAPAVEVEGAVGALLDRSDDVRVVLVGDTERIEAELARFPDAPRDRLEIAHASEVIEMGESPATAIRRKRDSSIVVGVRMLQAGEVDAFISAGSTGAVMAASLVILRAIPGVDRPPVGARIPTATGKCLALDVGANVDCKPHQLVQFAQLGSVYAADMWGVQNPRVGLLNIGTEPEKGNEVVLEAHQMLARLPNLNFIGNVEGREIVSGKCDVLVADGFVGNVMLKFYESVAGLITGMLRRELTETGAQLDLERVFRSLDYAGIGGAPLLGVNGVVIICHGGSPPLAIRNAIDVAAQSVQREMVPHMKALMALTADAPPPQDS
ncbi:MAG TPA: phosphate acyltransferase PlsX [Longimicrobium sp.]|jgi:glycerol-3-phosphate acyltransferase PlsX|uniref:phosphate acyltransferase PlsX n=1 Tax=Longimicrobium sp. TaxID=2029185 RepID=UPI002ED88725